MRLARRADHHGVRPIVQAELVVDDQPAHALLARTQEGYQHLAALANT